MLWSSYFGKIMMTVLIAMLPVIELRGAIPVATANGLEPRTAIIAAVIGNLLPIPAIILFVRRVFAWLRKRSEKWNGFVSRLEERAEKRADIVHRYAFWGLALFVAIPLPGTGAWTGALIAAMLNMRLRDAVPAITLGVVTAGMIVAFVSYGISALMF